MRTSIVERAAIGERIKIGRNGLSQVQLARIARLTPPSVSRFESGVIQPSATTLSRLASALGVSSDYLVGLTDDPTPADERTREVNDRVREAEERAAQEAEERLQAAADLTDPDVSPIQSAPGWQDEKYESVRRYESEDVRLAAGTGTFADQEPVAGEVKFRTSWLRKQRLRAKDVFLVDVLGDSMERTIFDGDAALVDETHKSPRSGKIYALRTGDGLIVKRLRKRDHRWWADSDNEEYEPQPHDDRARIMGRVVWWAHTDKG